MKVLAVVDKKTKQSENGQVVPGRKRKQRNLLSPGEKEVNGNVVPSK